MALQLFGHTIRLLQIFQIQLNPLDLARISVFLQLLDRFVGMLFFLREKIDFVRIMLEQMGSDAKANPGGASGDDINLSIVSNQSVARASIPTCFRILTFPLKSGMSLFGSNLFPVNIETMASANELSWVLSFGV